MRFVTRNRRHRSGRLSGGAQDRPIKVAGLGDPPFRNGMARPRSDPPTDSGGAQDPPIQSGGASEPRPFSVTESRDGRSEPGRYRYETHMEEEKRHRGDRMNRGKSPRCRSTPDDASSRRHGGEEGPSRRVLPTIKLGTYNGSTCLKTFLAKFENCSDYYDWNDAERLCHLRASLEGPAGQVLWDAGRQSSVDQVMQLLKNRFGSLNEEERYRTELKARQRRPVDVVEANHFSRCIRTFDALWHWPFQASRGHYGR